MSLADLLIPERVACGVEAASKQHALEILSTMLATLDGGVAEADVFDSFVLREHLCSTAIGHGVAVPHGRLRSATRALGAFALLRRGVDFCAPDGQPVDLVFGLIVPEHAVDEHLRLLAELAETFSAVALRDRLRGAGSGAELYGLLLGQGRDGVPSRLAL